MQQPRQTSHSGPSRFEQRSSQLLNEMRCDLAPDEVFRRVRTLALDGASERGAQAHLDPRQLAADCKALNAKLNSLYDTYLGSCLASPYPAQQHLTELNFQVFTLRVTLEHALEHHGGDLTQFRDSITRSLKTISASPLLGNPDGPALSIPGAALSKLVTVPNSATVAAIGAAALITMNMGGRSVGGQESSSSTNSQPPPTAKVTPSSEKQAPPKLSPMKTSQIVSGLGEPNIRQPAGESAPGVFNESTIIGIVDRPAHQGSPSVFWRSALYSIQSNGSMVRLANHPPQVNTNVISQTSVTFVDSFGEDVPRALGFGLVPVSSQAESQTITYKLYPAVSPERYPLTTEVARPSLEDSFAFQRDLAALTSVTTIENRPTELFKILGDFTYVSSTQLAELLEELPGKWYTKAAIVRVGDCDVLSIYGGLLLKSAGHGALIETGYVEHNRKIALESNHARLCTVSGPLELTSACKRALVNLTFFPEHEKVLRRVVEEGKASGRGTAESLVAFRDALTEVLKDPRYGAFNLKTTDPGGEGVAGIAKDGASAGSGSGALNTDNSLESRLRAALSTMEHFKFDPQSKELVEEAYKRYRSASPESAKERAEEFIETVARATGERGPKNGLALWDRLKETISREVFGVPAREWLGLLSASAAIVGGMIWAFRRFDKYGSEYRGRLLRDVRADMDRRFESGDPDPLFDNLRKIPNEQLEVVSTFLRQRMIRSEREKYVAPEKGTLVPTFAAELLTELAHGSHYRSLLSRMIDGQRLKSILKGDTGDLNEVAQRLFLGDSLEAITQREGSAKGAKAVAERAEKVKGKLAEFVQRHEEFHGDKNLPKVSAEVLRQERDGRGRKERSHEEPEFQVVRLSELTDTSLIDMRQTAKRFGPPSLHTQSVVIRQPGTKRLDSDIPKRPLAFHMVLAETPGSLHQLYDELLLKGPTAFSGIYLYGGAKGRDIIKPAPRDLTGRARAVWAQSIISRIIEHNIFSPMGAEQEKRLSKGYGDRAMSWEGIEALTLISLCEDLSKGNLRDGIFIGFDHVGADLKLIRREEPPARHAWRSKRTRSPF